MTETYDVEIIWETPDGKRHSFVYRTQQFNSALAVLAACSVFCNTPGGHEPVCVVIVWKVKE